MQYFWRVSLSAIIFFFNLFFSFLPTGDFSFEPILSLFINGGIGWLIGAQIDKYRMSKKELGSTKTVLKDYSFAMDTIGDAIGIINETGQFVFANEAMAKLYGYPKEEFFTLKLRDCYVNKSIHDFDGNSIPESWQGYWKGEAVGIKKDGTTFPQELSLSTIKESQNTICIFRDITEQKNYEEFMKYAAEHNDLTNLPNRRKLIHDLTNIKQDEKQTSLLFLDLDRFKLINDNYGHDVGDELLKNVAKRLLSFEDKMINVYHHGGDEFIIIIQCTNITYIKELAAAIIKKIQEPYSINGIEVWITTSIGISFYPYHTHDITDLIKFADTAMYYAKLDGKNTFKFFNEELEWRLERKSKLESELRKALINNELHMFYQPKFQLDSFEIVGMEALIRWEHPELGLISPMEFIPIAEETGLILTIGKWVIHEVLQQMRIWQDQGYPCMKVSVNVSSRQFRDKDLVQTIRSGLHIFHIDPNLFEIEITESEIADTELSIPILKSLKEIGVSISIDDFGTGYSSLNVLKDLPIDTIKIDQSFVRDLLEHPKENLLVMAILQIGNILGLKVVAEGIETEKQLQHLLMLNCRIGQGYYFSKPIKVTEFENRFLKGAPSELSLIRA
ncbi:sensor domain-containing protein [Neobacillus sp. Marseille-QA0830]